MRDSKSICRHLCSELVFITRADRRGRQAILGNLEEIGEWFAEILTECAFPRDAASADREPKPMSWKVCGRLQAPCSRWDSSSR